MKEKYEYIKSKFDMIESLGFIKCNYHDKGGPGRMLEKLLVNKKPDNSKKPDYEGIEIKTCCNNSKYKTTLFSLIPNVNNLDFENLMKYFINFYYLGKKKLSKENSTSMPHFYLSVRGKNNFYLNGCLKFNLVFNDIEKRLYLDWENISTKDKHHCIYWNYNEIISAFVSKLNYLVLIKYDKFYSCGYIYCKYNSINFFQQINKDSIIKLLKEGKIVISFNISSKYDKNNNVVPYYHGIRFEIDPNELFELYKTIN